MATKKPKKKTKKLEKCALLSKEQERFIAELHKCKGNISKAAKRALISRAIAYVWKEESIAFRDAWADVDEALLDDAKECFAASADRDWKAAEAYIRHRERTTTEIEGAPITIEGKRGSDRLSVQKRKLPEAIDGTSG